MVGGENLRWVWEWEGSLSTDFLSPFILCYLLEGSKPGTRNWCVVNWVHRDIDSSLSFGSSVRSLEPGFLGLVTSGHEKASSFMLVFHTILLFSRCAVMWNSGTALTFIRPVYICFGYRDMRPITSYKTWIVEVGLSQDESPMVP